MIRWRVALLVAVLAIGGVGGLRAARMGGEVSETFYVFGTLVEIVIRGEAPATARTAMAAAQRSLQRFHDDWHAWRPGRLGDLNAAIAQGRSIAVAEPLAAVLQQGWRLSCQSGGLFDPAIGGLVALWGFHADTPPTGGIPAPQDIAALLAAAPRMTDLRFDAGQVEAVNQAVRLDLGGFAKGAALDLIAAQLRAMGIRNAVLNAGGDVNVLGRHGGRAWRVAIRDPFVWGAVAAISLRPGEVLYTSGNYERFFEQGGTRFAHIIDPRTGAPVRDVVSVSVLDTDGARADAAATALSVAGRAGWPQVAADMGVDAVLLIDGAGGLYASPAMAARLEPVGDALPGPLRIVDLPVAKRTAACP